MRQMFLFLAATGCAYQDDDSFDVVAKTCRDSPWTAEGWDAEGLPEPLASDASCQRVLAEHTGAVALGDAELVLRDQIVWSAWTLALGPMVGPPPGDPGAGPALAWADGGQPALYEHVVQRLAASAPVSTQRHALEDGDWGAVRGLDTHADMLPLMVHESAHWMRPGHDPCSEGAPADGRPCDPTYDSPTGWEAAVATLLHQGLDAAEDDTGLSGRLASTASAASGAVQEAAGIDPPDEEDDGDDLPAGLE